MSTTRIDWENRASVINAILQWPDVFEQELRAGLDIAGAVVTGLVIEKTPVSDGTMVSSINWTDPYATAHGWAVGIGDPLVYGDVIEHGRTAGSTPPPYRALVPWVWSHRHYFDGVTTEAQCVGVAIAIAKKIGRWGFKSLPDGAKMYQKAAEDGEPKVNEIMAAARDRIEKRCNESVN